MLPRKIWHASGILVVVVYEVFDVPRPVGAAILFGIALFLLGFDVLRHRSPALQDLFRRKLGVILDEKDMKGLNGSTLYFGGCAFAVALCPKDAACAGIFALAFGDPAAAIVGSSVKSPRWRRVSLAGSTACLVTATLAVRWYFPWPIALLGGIAATALEAFSGSKLDNFAIPVGTALVLASLAP